MSNTQWRTAAIQKLVDDRGLKSKVKSTNPSNNTMQTKNKNIIEKAKKGLSVNVNDMNIF